MSLFKNEKGDLLTGRILFFSLTGVLLIWAATFIVLFYMEKPGEIGDSFGMVNALFSALAFSLLIYTSLLQTQELRLQREELRENRKQLESSAKAHNELVSLTKVINREKVVPKLEILNFEESENSIHFNLKVLFDEIYFDEIKIGEHYSVVDQNGESTNKDRYLADDIISPFKISKNKLKANSEIFIIYRTAGGNKYFQIVYDKSSIWRLSEPREIEENNFRDF